MHLRSDFTVFRDSEFGDDFLSEVMKTLLFSWTCGLLFGLVIRVDFAEFNSLNFDELFT